MNGRTNTTAVGFSKGVSIPLEAPTGFSGTSGDRTATITWTDPVNKYANPGGELVSEWSHDIVVRKIGSAPISPTDGDQILKTTTRDQCVTEPYVDSGLINDQEYYYGIYSYNQFGLESNGLVGSIVPTHYASVSYLQTITSSIDMSSYYSEIATFGANSNFTILVGNGQCGSNFDTFSSELIRNTIPMTWNQSSSPIYASAQVANTCILCGDSTISIDPNCIQTSISSGALSGSMGCVSVADVDHKCAYAFAYGDSTNSGSQYYPRGKQSAYKYDANLVVTKISNLPIQVYDKGRSLSSKYYAVITGFATTDAANNGNYRDLSYLYTENGTYITANTPYARGCNVSTSRCDDSILIFGGSKDASKRIDSNKSYAITKDAVVSEIAQLSSTSFSANYNIQTMGLGMAPHGKGIDYYDKRLVNHGIISTIVRGPVESPRIGNYVMIADPSNEYSSTKNIIYVFENK